jgi:retron-type reverse transcriptase
VDKLVLKTPAARGKMVDMLAHYSLWKAKPTRRVYIPKASGSKLRPLGIPVVIDRCLQAMVKNALEPVVLQKRVRNGKLGLILKVVRNSWYECCNPVQMASF